MSVPGPDDRAACIQNQSSFIPGGVRYKIPSFSHLFSSSTGYAAGYYSYLWAEVLSSDAFARFEEEGFFDSKVGKSFLHEILERGGSADMVLLYERFRGRPASLDALLRHHGIA